MANFRPEDYDLTENDSLEAIGDKIKELERTLMNKINQKKKTQEASDRQDNYDQYAQYLQSGRSGQPEPSSQRVQEIKDSTGLMRLSPKYSEEEMAANRPPEYQHLEEQLAGLNSPEETDIRAQKVQKKKTKAPKKKRLANLEHEARIFNRASSKNRASNLKKYDREAENFNQEELPDFAQFEQLDRLAQDPQMATLLQNPDIYAALTEQYLKISEEIKIL